MQRISTLLQKINELASKDEANVIDIDLMMDYTRVVYADLLEWRSRVSFNSSLNNAPAPPAPAPVPPTPRQAEVPQAPPYMPQELPTHTEPEPVAAATPIQEAEHHTKPLADIRKWIGINDKYQFISELFGNDKDAYEVVLAQINEMTDYNAAAAFLDDIHTHRQWNDEDITIQSFYGVVSQFFSER